LLQMGVRAHGHGDTVIAVVRSREGTARDGKPHRNRYSWYMQMQDDKFVNATGFVDTLEFNEFWNRIKPEVAIAF
jgi:uncharacterized protein